MLCVYGIAYPNFVRRKKARKPITVIRPMKLWVFSNASGIMVSDTMASTPPAAIAVVVATITGEKRLKTVYPNRAARPDRSTMLIQTPKIYTGGLPAPFIPSTLERPCGMFAWDVCKKKPYENLLAYCDTADQTDTYDYCFRDPV
jgi:hypothetical protein